MEKTIAAASLVMLKRCVPSLGVGIKQCVQQALEKAFSITEKQS
jgi:hypothetical protein